MKRRAFLICFLFFLLFICNQVYAQKKQETEDIDQKVYEWIYQLQRPNGLVEETDKSNFVSLYSNALASIVYTYKGDTEKAKKVFNWFLKNIKESEGFPGGFGQFRDANGHVAAPHRWMGDNCWLLIALKYYEKKTGDVQFQPLIKNLEKWIRGLQDKDGGIRGGYHSNGGLIEKNTEGNIDAINAIRGYDKFHKDLFKYLKKSRWDKKNKIFTTNWPPYNLAPDFISWGYLAFGNKYRYFLNFADKFMITRKSSLGPEVTGISFDLVEEDGVWIEATGQMALAYKVAGIKNKSDFLIKEIEKMYVPSSSNPAVGGIVYTTNMGTMFGPERLWEGADKNPALGTSCWYLMAKWNIDPMAAGRKKLIRGLKKDNLY